MRIKFSMDEETISQRSCATGLETVILIYILPSVRKGGYDETHGLQLVDCEGSRTMPSFGKAPMMLEFIATSLTHQMALLNAQIT